MDFRQAEIFLAVAEHGGLARAASVLHLTQSSVSQSIRQLEGELKTPLFHRAGHGLVLTAAGHTLLKPTRQVLRDALTARASVAEVVGQKSARLELITGFGGFDHVADAIGRLRQRFPDVTVYLEEAAGEADLVRAVRDGRCELGVGYLSWADLDDGLQMDTEGLEVHALGSDELCLLLPPGTDPDLPDPLPVTALLELPVIAIPRENTGRALIENMLRGAGIRTTLGVVTAYSDMQIPLVLAGCGLTWASRSQAAAAAGQVVVRGFDPRVTLPVNLVHRSGELAPAAKAFVDLALDRSEH